MLSVLYPEVYRLIKSIPGGLIPIGVGSERTPILVVKVPKEYILAAKVNGQFKIYLAPISYKQMDTVCLISAFFDDQDEPLVVSTPLLNDEVTSLFSKLFRSERVKIFFLDEHSREYLSYSSSISVTQESLQLFEESDLMEPIIEDLFAIQNLGRNWFGEIGDKNYQDAITLSLDENLYPEDTGVIDLRKDNSSYEGAQGFEFSRLEREEPGDFQENDIIRCLQSVFSPNQIYKSPRRTYDNEEVCDVLVVTESRVLLIQAKDSPNIERILRAEMPRKRKKTEKSLDSALRQTRGSIRYFNRERAKFQFICGEKSHLIDTENLSVYTVVIVKELFDDQSNEYAENVLELSNDLSVKCVPFDYPEFYNFCIKIAGEEAFFKTLDNLHRYAFEKHYFPRMLFRPR